MANRWRLGMLIALAVWALAIANSFSRTASAQPATEEEVLTRGPVHEAFAEVIQLTPLAGIVITREPPAAIEETPPDERPAGDNVIWIPGYWAWDDDRNDFIWISGVWRIPPPDRTWVPGYWNQVQEGWQWISGFWAPAQMQDIDYLPPVPTSLDTGPNSPLPGNDYLWSAGCWQWRPGGWLSRARYVWGPGSWRQVRPGWVWVPAHYVWTCNGCVFVDGYWDYAPEERGVLFAPMYFPRQRYADPSFRYRPTFCIDIGIVFGSFFCRPQYGHYYFGDYYDRGYADRGIYPWFERERVHTWYSPFSEYTAWNHERENPRWRDEVRRDFNDRREHVELRPARTYAALEIQIGRLPERDRERYAYAKPLTVYATASRSPLHFERVSADVQLRYVEQGRERRKLTVERASLERGRAVPGRSGEFKPSKLRLPETGRVKAVSASGAPRQRAVEQPLPAGGAEPRGQAPGKRETKGRQELPPAAAVGEPAPQRKSRDERGAAPEGAPSGKRDSKRETKGQEQPPPPSDQKGGDKKGGDQKGESRDKHEGDSKDKGGDKAK